MNNFAGLLGGVLFLALVAGLIKPPFVLRWVQNPTRLKVVGYWFIATFLVSVFGFMFESTEQKKEASMLAEEVSSVPENIRFEQVGYHKNEDIKLRYFTFAINSKYVTNRDSISADIFEKIKQHGGKQMHTKGKVTASFYYLGKENTPDITNLSSDMANKVAHENKPVASVWIMPTGKINLFENPDFDDN